MGWAVGYDERHKRDIGYGVPAICDHSDCNEEIDRGLAYVCGSDVYGGEDGCGLFFCSNHRVFVVREERCVRLCGRCESHQEPFSPKPDTQEWMDWKLTDPSWAQWREENPDQVSSILTSTEKEAGT